MKFPFVRRKKHDAALRHEKARRVKAKESSERSKNVAERAKKKVKRLENRISELLAIHDILHSQLQAKEGAKATEAARPCVVESVNGDLRSLFAHKLEGEGIEIGALHFPLPVPPGVTVRYVDKRTKKENEDTFPELAGKAIVETDWIGDGQWLEGMADESQNFVIANHMLEHCVNPLKTLEHFLRVLRPGGRLFIALPDKRFTFDVGRPITPFDHVLRDYHTNREVEDREMYEEYRDFVDASFNVDVALQTRADIHHHVWTQAEVLEFFIGAKRQLGWPLEIELFGKQGIEVVLVLQKIEPVHGDHAKRFAAPAAAAGPSPTAVEQEGADPSAPPSPPAGTPESTDAAPAGAAVAGRYVPFAWTPDDAYVQIEETWSSDGSFGMRGFVLVHAGEPSETSFTFQGVLPTFIQWIDRPDVYQHAVFARFPKCVKCGFMVVFPRQAIHALTVILPSALGSQQKTLAVPATGLPALACGANEPAGVSMKTFAERVNRECRSVLEIGSRVVSPGSISKRSFFDPHVTYTGFDYYADGNTDVVGDAHRLSSYFPVEHKFDAVFSLAVLEHIAMPWRVALEINRVLAIGGLAFHSTPFTWPLHETPWDFWRFSHEGLRMLFSPALGFEVVDLGLTEPCRIQFDSADSGLLATSIHTAYGESNILVRKVRDVDSDLFRWDTSLAQVLPQESAYPKPA